jgi:ABC-type multidrug transport system fused ATPase/permease subunit
MTKKIILVLLLLFGALIAETSSGMEINQLFTQANQQYRAGNFKTAIKLYESILKQGYESAAVYYNLGNSYFRENHIGLAVLNYEKAQKLKPRDADIQYNLELANLKVVDRVELPPRFFLFEWWSRFKNYFSMNQLAYLMVILFFISIVLIIAWLFIANDRIRRILVGVTIFTVLVTILFASIFFMRLRETSRHPEAVILAQTVNVFSAPDETSTNVFVLHEGSKVALDDQRGEWVKMSLPDGKTGWIRNEAIGII